MVTSLITHSRYIPKPGHLPRIPVGEHVLRVARVCEFQTRSGMDATEAVFAADDGALYSWLWLRITSSGMAEHFSVAARQAFDDAGGREGETVRVVVTERLLRGNAAKSIGLAKWSRA